MIQLTIDNKKISVPSSTTILHAAKLCGIKIPTLCFADGLPPKASCMMCAVKDRKSGKVIPSCESIAEDGMNIETNTPDVIETRKHTLELLLSEHKGECEAPCLRTCPLHPDIPEILRSVREGNLSEAEKLIGKELPFAGVLCKACSAPCEKACRRNRIDQSLAIKDIIQSVITNNTSNKKYIPEKKDKTGKRIAVIGAGHSGFSCAYFLLRENHDVAIFHSGKNSVSANNDIMHNINNILKDMGADVTDNKEKKLSHISGNYDVIVMNKDEKNFQIGNNIPAFECRDIIDKADNMLHSAVKGKETAKLVHNYLTNRNDLPANKKFNSVFGKTTGDDIIELMKCANPENRNPERQIIESLNKLKQEAARCLRCGCLKKDACSLRNLASEYNADRNHFSGEQIPFTRKMFREFIIEQGKCVKCGICVRISKKAGWDRGFAFLKRGFDLEVGLPLNLEPEADKMDILHECIRQCPTGALFLNR